MLKRSPAAIAERSDGTAFKEKTFIRRAK